MKSTIRMMLLLLLSIGVAACGADTDDAGSTDNASSGDEAGAAIGAPADGGLTVPEALETDAEGPLTVQGFLMSDGSTVRLCQVALESYPPQCGGDSVEVEGVDVESLEGATTEGDVTWVDFTTLTGHLESGVLMVDETIQG